MFLALAAMPVAAAARPQTHRFSISGSLQPTPALSEGAGYQSQSTLSRLPTEKVVQQNDRFVLSARLADTMLACGADLIFENGFEAPAAEL